MNNLPKEFLERMQLMLGDEYEAFLRSYDEPRRSGLRINKLKKGRGDTSELSRFLRRESTTCRNPVRWPWRLCPA